MDETKCDTCGKKFLRKRSHIAYFKHHYCSDICYRKSLLKGSVVKCSTCGRETYKQLRDLSRSKSKKWFCGKKCTMEWQNTTFIGSRHPNWRGGGNSESYRNVLKRSNVRQRCILCHFDDMRILVAHHIDWNRKNNKLRNLTWICPNCHFLVHHYQSYQSKLLKIC